MVSSCPSSSCSCFSLVHFRDQKLFIDAFLDFTSLSAGLGAGVTEAVMVVGPMEVVKIRLQAQVHSMTDPLDVPKYRNAAHALFVILREEGPKTLYRGVGLTALRQATNQGERAQRRIRGTHRSS